MVGLHTPKFVSKDMSDIVELLEDLNRVRGACHRPHTFKLQVRSSLIDIRTRQAYRVSFQ